MPTRTETPADEINHAADLRYYGSIEASATSIIAYVLTCAAGVLAAALATIIFWG
jgi:hypothetical protein